MLRPLQRCGPNHYATLGLDHLCSSEQIRSAYRMLAKRHHPDLNPNSTAAQARTQDLNAAYEILGDPELRHAYDESLAAEAEPTPGPRAIGSKARCPSARSTTGRARRRSWWRRIYVRVCKRLTR